MGYTEIVDLLTRYYSTNGTLADAVAFSQLVAAHAVKELRHLLDVIQGSV